MKKWLNLEYSMIQALYWMLYSAAGVFVAVFLLDKGYSNTSIGAIMAAGSLIAILLQAAVSDIADRVARFTNITAIKMLIFMLIAAVIIVLLIGERSTAMTIAYVGLIIIHTVMHPFVNALSFTLEETGYKVSYGLGRSMGSLFAGILSFMMGYLVIWFSPNMILYVALINLGIMTIVIFMTDRHYKQGLMQKAQSAASEALPSAAEKVSAISMTDFAKGNIVFIIMSIGVVALFFGNVILENFTIQIIEGIGGNTEDMGMMIGIMSVLEMPAMLAFGKLKDRFSYVFLLRVAAVFFTAKIVIMYLGHSMAFFYIAQLCQIPGYGLLFPAMVSFIDHIMKKGEAMRGQAIFTAAITIGNVLGSIFGGMILDEYDSRMLLMISSVISVCGTMFIVALVNRINKKEVTIC